MNVLFTGASSFSGYWFARRLTEAGHSVVATFTNKDSEYIGLRAERVSQLSTLAERRFCCSFGSERFSDLVAGERSWDVLCLHAAFVTDYRSPKFDFLAATSLNVHRLGEMLDLLRQRGLTAVVFTGTVFEADEGAGENPLEAFSAYGLSKTLTWEVVRYEALRRGLRLGKCVIPNPFGPWEEPRFCSYLARTWLANQKVVVKTPSYVRDNIHVSLLAAAYVELVRRVTGSQEAVTRLDPSGYVETQGSFTERFAQEMRLRLKVPCEFDCAEQTDFSEPIIRVNTTRATRLCAGWQEKASWDELSDFYMHARRKGLL